MADAENWSNGLKWSIVLDGMPDNPFRLRREKDHTPACAKVTKVDNELLAIKMETKKLLRQLRMRMHMANDTRSRARKFKALIEMAKSSMSRHGLTAIYTDKDGGELILPTSALMHAEFVKLSSDDYEPCFRELIPINYLKDQYFSICKMIAEFFMIPKLWSLFLQAHGMSEILYMHP